MCNARDRRSDTFDTGKFLKEEYTLSCETSDFDWWAAYASFFIFVYPIGVPLLCLSVLFVNREKINPQGALDRQARNEGGRVAKVLRRVSSVLTEREKDHSLDAVRFLFEMFTPACWSVFFTSVVRWRILIANR